MPGLVVPGPPLHDILVADGEAGLTEATSNDGAPGDWPQTTIRARVRQVSTRVGDLMMLPIPFSIKSIRYRYLGLARSAAFVAGNLERKTAYRKVNGTPFL
jgi:hypothetical protein